MSNHTIHNASIYQDSGSVKIAIVIYALYKLKLRGKDCPKIADHLKNIRAMLKQGRHEEFHRATNTAIQYLSNIDKKIRLYIDEVIKSAQIQKGYKIFDHGISIAQAASLLGISQWELRSYVGSNIPRDLIPDRVSFSERLENARRMFQ